MDWDTCQVLDRPALGRLGEQTAALFLIAKGFPILGRNLVLDLGEIDILTRIAGVRTLVEVRSTRSRADAAWPPPHPLAAFDFEKARQVRKVAGGARCGRIDLISVSFHADGIDLRWVPRVV